MFHTDLSVPPVLPADTLRIIPLGGLGDVGRNMTAFEINGEILLIDAGVLFPEEDHPGVDLILPGYDAIADRWEDVVGLVLTHGHEDHIGAVPYLLKECENIKVYGSRLTLAFLEPKLREHRISSPQLIEVAEGETLMLGSQFRTEFVAVNHSIPDSLAVFLRTSGGTVLHTGDFKMDQLPLDKRLTDLRSFARFGEEGVDLMMVDSTNAEVPGFTTGELEVEPALRRVFDAATGKIVVACFASHIYRVQQVLNQAAIHGRVVVFMGRSMVRNMGIAQEMGYLEVPPQTLADPGDLDVIPEDKLVIICTGSQGEPMSALSRMASQTHQNIEIGPEDTVMLASSLIPGNENSVYRVINGLTRLGVTVVHKANALVHVSGHASSGELLYCYNIVKPKNAMPIHGEHRHLIANGKLARSTGVESVLTVEDGTVIDLHDHQARVVGQVDTSYILVDGASVGAISEENLADRRILGAEGFVTVIAVVQLEDKDVSSIDIHARGFIDDDGVFDDVTPQISANLKSAIREGITDTYLLQQNIRRTIGRWVSTKLKSRPMILPIVIHT
ncbi:MAG: ribonuclease J [Propionibacteriaceae bacterium]|jgi:ribonuclease J|nr:ribonuclease J [Propionibacteriaceae bacterium]